MFDGLGRVLWVGELAGDYIFHHADPQLMGIDPDRFHEGFMFGDFDHFPSWFTNPLSTNTLFALLDGIGMCRIQGNAPGSKGYAGDVQTGSVPTGSVTIRKARKCQFRMFVFPCV